MSSWMCDGVPKDGNSYPNASAHEPYENTTPDCVICGLPKEAMQPSTKIPRKTVYVGKPDQKSKQSQWLIPAIVVGVALLAAGGGFSIVRMLMSDRSPGPTETPIETTTPAAVVGDFASENATNSQLLSQGEKILLDPTSQKQAGADAFANKDWDGAIASYQQAADNNPNDPEGRIYLNNAQARKAGNPLTIAVAVPITPSPDSAKEVLRGVARAQEEFNQSASGRLLEVVIANDAGALQSASLAQDIINAPDVLGVLGHGIDPGSQQALRKYQSAGLAVLSPLTISVDSGQSTLKTIPIDQKANELFGSYLQAVSKTLIDYANKNASPLSVVVFYNSDSAYSEQLKEQLVKAVPQVRGQLIEEIDIMDGGFNADTAIANAEQSGAKVAFLALSKNKVPQAIAIATANASGASPLALLGGDELYNADILVRGGDAIQGITLAVPWSFQPNDPFAQDAIQSWKGRVSWRTATAYDATKALVQAVSQDPNRAGVNRLLEAGISLTGSTTNFNIFNEVPLVKAVPGSGGPPGSKYEFASVR